MSILGRLIFTSDPNIFSYCMLGKYSIPLPFTKQQGTGTCNLGPDGHWRNFALKSCGDQWRRQDLVPGGHDDRGASIEVPKAPCGLGYGEGCLLSSRLRIWWSVMSSPSRVRGGAPAAVAFSAYFRPQNASGSKKNTVLTVAALCVKLQYCET